MQSSPEFRMGLVVVAAVALVTGACSNMPSWSDVKLPTTSTFIPTNANAFNQASVNTAKPVTAADYVDAQGACAAASAASSEGEQEQTSARGVSLDMTECQVVQALGAPEATDIATNARGERAVTLTYLRAERAGLYRFMRGRLVSIERAPGAAEPERPARQPAKKQAKKPEPS